MKKMENKLGSHNNILRIVIVAEIALRLMPFQRFLRDLRTFPFLDLAHLGNLLPNAIFSRSDKRLHVSHRNKSKAL